MKILRIIFPLIAFILIGLTIYVTYFMKKYNEEPSYQYKNSEHSVSYFFDLSKISLIFDKDKNVISLVNADNQQAVIVEKQVSPDLYIAHILTDWQQVSSSGNKILLIPPTKCKYFEVNTYINKDDGAYLSDILNYWDQCKS